MIYYRQIKYYTHVYGDVGVTISGNFHITPVVFNLILVFIPYNMDHYFSNYLNIPILSTHIPYYVSN